MITSKTNEQVKYIQKLQKKKSYRQLEKCFIIEGWHMLEEVPELLIKKIYVIEEHIEQVKKVKSEMNIVVVSLAVLKEMSQITTSQGVLAIVQIPKVDESILNRKNGLVIALDNIQDPGNLGTIIRTAEAAGVNQIVLSKGTVDLYNPKVVQATMGAIFRLNIIKDIVLIPYLEKLKKIGYKVMSAHINANEFYYNIDYTGNTCFLMGNEGEGLKGEILDKTTLIKIPMNPTTESLNVAMATGILVYEALRQRSL